MPAKLAPDKVLKRTFKIYGIEEPCIVTLSTTGIRVQIAKTKTSVEQSWPQLVAAMNTPGNVPSYLAGKPYQFLQVQAQRRRKKEQENAE